MLKKLITTGLVSSLALGVTAMTAFSAEVKIGFVTTLTTPAGVIGKAASGSRENDPLKFRRIPSRQLNLSMRGSWTALTEIF